jgi:hypothetical protein
LGIAALEDKIVQQAVGGFLNPEFCILMPVSASTPLPTATAIQVDP